MNEIIKTFEEVEENDLLEYLDQWVFLSKVEMEMATQDWYKECVSDDENYQLSYGEISYAMDVLERVIEKHPEICNF